MVTITVMLIGLLAFTSTSLVVHTVNEAERERRLAVSGLRAAVGRLQARSAAAVESTDGWSTTITGAYAGGGDPGTLFDIQGLDPWDAAVSVGTIQVVVDETTSDNDLDVDMGMPRDLDMDGMALSNDVSDDAELLPVVFTVRWSGAGGDRELVQGIWISRM